MPRRIPVEDFFRKPERVYLRLSPAGTHLAWLAPHDRRLNVFVQDLASREITRVTEAGERDVAGYLWASDERLVYIRDQGGDENWRMYSVGRDGADPRDLTPFDGVQCRIVDDLEDVPDQILFSMNRRDAQVFDVYRLDVRTGSMDLVAENPGNVQSWITDHAGRLRAATTTDGVHTSILFRETEADEWRVVATYDFKETAQPLFFTFDDRNLFVASNVGRDKTAIFEYDVATGKEGRLIFEHPEVDVHHLLYSRRRTTLTAVRFQTDKGRYHFLDDDRERMQRAIDAALPGGENVVTSQDRAERRFVVHSGSDRNVGAYYLYERDGDRVTKLYDVAPWLDPAEMAEMRPITYAARDGLTVHGYLTLPPGLAPERLPLVVHPHGGPWHRDSWGFDPECQFLANRGYAVLQMNFRGSTGYGREFLEASFGQWGLAMQDDVTDGVRWAVGQGFADPDRVAIYGGSYGGYATLSGITKTPELYRCAVSYVGVSNLFTWIEAIPPYWKPYLEMMYEMVGHPERDRDRFRATSPLFHADRIRCPLFVAQGANDPRVRKEESDQIVQALRDRGIDVHYLVKDDEGHGFRNEENTLEFYRELDAFLADHL